VYDLPPTHGRERVGQPKGAQNVGGDEVKDGPPRGGSQRSRGVGPLFIRHSGASLPIGQVCMSLAVGVGGGDLFDTAIRLGRNDDGPEAGLTSVSLVAGLLGTRLLRVVVVLFERDTRVMELASLWPNDTVRGRSGRGSIVGRRALSLFLEETGLGAQVTGLRHGATSEARIDELLLPNWNTST